MGLRLCVASADAGAGEILPVERAAGGETRPSLVEGGDKRPLTPGGETLPGGDTRPTLAPRGEDRPGLTLEGDTPPVRDEGSTTVGDPADAGIERRVSESRRLWPYGRGAGGGGGW